MQMYLQVMQYVRSHVSAAFLVRGEIRGSSN